MAFRQKPTERTLANILVFERYFSIGRRSIGLCFLLPVSFNPLYTTAKAVALAYHREPCMPAEAP